jgi:NADP-dependent 3-hydroxy acid dehydrogenase YdfG
MPKPIRGSVIVITGASSGIGRAAATAAAQQGANLVLAARQEDALRAVAAECERLGGHALAVPTDVIDQSQVTMAASALLALTRGRSNGHAGREGWNR